jgi:hypothetical protein
MHPRSTERETVPVEVRTLDQVAHVGVGGELDGRLQLLEVDGARAVFVDIVEEL